jgi:hypothetical protein
VRNGTHDNRHPGTPPENTAAWPHNEETKEMSETCECAACTIKAALIDFLRSRDVYLWHEEGETEFTVCLKESSPNSIEALEDSAGNIWQSDNISVEEMARALAEKLQ